MTTKPILCLDFDGVLHSYESGWKGADVVADGPVLGAVAFLMEAVRVFEVHVFSSRSHQGGGIRAMQESLHRWIREDNWPEAVATGIVYGYNDTPPAVRFPTEKPSAMVTIDDRALTFTGTWPDVSALLAFKPWNKP